MGGLWSSSSISREEIDMALAKAKDLVASNPVVVFRQIAANVGKTVTGFMEMEAVVGGETELVNGLGLNVDKENEIVDTGVLQANGTPEDQLKVESLRPAVTGEAKPVAVARNKASKRLVRLPNTKGMKDGGVRNGEAVASGNVKAVLSKSISFPAKSVPVSTLRKSTTFVKPKKTEAKNSGQNCSEGLSVVSEGGYYNVYFEDRLLMSGVRHANLYFL